MHFFNKCLLAGCIQLDYQLFFASTAHGPASMPRNKLNTHVKIKIFFQKYFDFLLTLVLPMTSSANFAFRCTGSCAKMIAAKIRQQPASLLHSASVHQLSEPQMQPPRRLPLPITGYCFLLFYCSSSASF